MWQQIVNFMFAVLNYFYEVSGNYGIAIILLTISIKLLFYPLSVKQFKAMHGMKKIQPKIKELQKKHAKTKNPEKMQQEMIALYKEHGVNPLGGCLPLVIQMPFMIALFYTLRSDMFVNLQADKSFLWITNLTQPDQLMIFGVTVPIMAILVGLSTYFSQKSMSTDPEQAKMMAFMPFMLFFISIKLHAGVLLYWVVSNIITTAQQMYLEKKFTKN